MNEVILNGVSSNTINGLLIQELPPVSKPLMRANVEEIDGRDGDIITKLGYSAYDKAMLIGLYGNFDIDEVIEFFNSSGKVTFSNEPDKYYNYQILEQIDFERLVRFRQATVKFHVQPFKYKVDEEQIQVDTTMITAEGSNNMTLEYTQGGATLQIDLKGNTKQTGKNLFNMGQSFPASSSFTAVVSGNTLTLTATGTAGAQYTTAYVHNCNASNSYIFSCKAKKVVKGTNGMSRITVYIYGSNDGSTYSSTLTGITNNDPTQGTEYSFNSGVVTGYTHYRFYIYNNNSTPVTVGEKTQYYDIQFEEGTVATDFEPYFGGIPSPDYPVPIHSVSGDNTVTVCGKNLFDISKTESESSSAYCSLTNSNGVLTLTAIGTIGAQYIKNYVYNCDITETYTLSFKAKKVVKGTDGAPHIKALIYGSNDDGITYINIDSVQVNNPIEGTEYSLSKTVQGYKAYRIYLYNNGSTPVTIGEQTQYYDIQFEVGTATAYEPYMSQEYPINLPSGMELNKIGSCADYFHQQDGSWYVHKAVKESGVVATGGGAFGSCYRWFYTDNEAKSYSTSIVGNLCTHFSEDNNVFVSTTVQVGMFGQFRDYKQFYFASDKATKAEFNTWCNDNNVRVYCALATAEEIEVTDATLISQLNAISQAMSYNGTTNILQENNDLPFWLDVEAYGNVNSHILNDGNYTARPLLTIYGTGNIGVYLNEIQVFQIEMGDNDKIAIDSAKMEAYDPDTKALLNRLVTGDYSNFVLKKGQNELVFSGSVQGFTLDNYTRWL